MQFNAIADRDTGSGPGKRGIVRRSKACGEPVKLCGRLCGGDDRVQRREVMPGGLPYGGLLNGRVALHRCVFVAA
jgi:hypothetical protein